MNPLVPDTAPAEARAEIATLQRDAGFRQALAAGDEGAKQRWSAAHQRAYPTPPVPPPPPAPRPTEVEMLKANPAFRERLLAGDAQARVEWDAAHRRDAARPKEPEPEPDRWAGLADAEIPLRPQWTDREIDQAMRSDHVRDAALALGADGRTVNELARLVLDRTPWSARSAYEDLARRHGEDRAAEIVEHSRAAVAAIVKASPAMLDVFDMTNSPRLAERLAAVWAQNRRRNGEAG